MRKTQVDFVEIIHDKELRKKEKVATKAIQRFYPASGPVKLYRTSDGRIGFQAQISVTAGDRKRLEQAYRAIMDALGERRGRRAGPKTVQAKLRLPEPVYSALKRAAKGSAKSMSSVVAEALRVSLGGAHRLC